LVKDLILGGIQLIWGSSEGAVNYSVYQYDQYIIEINNSIIKIAEDISNCFLYIYGLKSGVYYFKVVAKNNFGNSTSNCIQIILTLSSPSTDDDDDNNSNQSDGIKNPVGIFILCITLGFSVIALIVFLKKRSYKSTVKERNKLVKISKQTKAKQ